MAHARWVTASALAELLPVSVATIRRHAKELGGRKIPGGRVWLFNPDVVAGKLSGA